MRVLRIFHSAVVDAWRERERQLRALGADVDLLTARRWNEGGTDVALVARPGEPVTGVRTWGRHPALFVYAPLPLWRALGRPYDVIDIHEEPFALATAEILLLRRLRRQRAPYVLYSAQNIDKRYPPPFRWLERWALRHAAALSVCNSEAGRICERKGFPGAATLIPLGVDTERFSPGPARPEAEAPVIGYVGRLEPHKGVDVLLEAARRGRRRRRCGSPAPAPRSRGLRARMTALGIDDRVELVGSLTQDSCRTSTAAWTSSSCRRGRRPAGWSSSAAWSSRRWRAASRSSPATRAPCPTWSATPACSSRPATREALAAALHVGARGRRRRAASWRVAASSRPSRRRGPRSRAPTSACTSARSGTTADPQRGLEVVVVAYGRPDLLEDSLQPVLSFPVTVVDNSSSPDVAAVCERLGVRYLDPGHNGGFGAGVNHALDRRLDPDADVLLLNPDAVIGSDDVLRLHRALLADPDPRLRRAHPGRRGRPPQPGVVALPLPRAHLADGGGTGSARRVQRLRDRLRADAAPGGPGPGRAVRRGVLPVRRGDRLGLPRAPARLAAPRGDRSPGRARRRRDERRPHAPRDPLPRVPGAVPAQALRSGPVAARSRGHHPGLRRPRPRARR